MFPFLFGIFIVIVVLQLGYYGLLFRFSFYRKQYSNKEKHPISILVSCKNEGENLQKTLPKLVAQEYPEFEIILVDDASTDHTLSILKEYSKKHDFVHYISIPKTDNYNGNKKNALTKAIQNSSYEHLLFTDADCIPKSKFWAENMAAQFSESKVLILGYGAYKKTTGWLNKLIRYETLFTAWQYFSYALVGLPYMGVGRNMGYTKSLFKKANGFISHENILSGDDDLLVNQMGARDNVAICWQSESQTVSEPEKTFRSWWKQKRRHITTANSYKTVHKVLLGLFYLSQFLFYLVGGLLLLFDFRFQTVLLLVGLRFLVYVAMFIPAARKLNENDLILWAPFLDFILVAAQMCIFINNLVQKPTKW